MLVRIDLNLVKMTDTNLDILPVQHILLPDDVQGRIDHCAEDPLTKTLFVSCLGSDCVAVVDLFAGAVISTIRDQSIYRPQGMGFHNGVLAVASVRGITLCFIERAPPSSFAVAKYESIPAEECDNIRSWRRDMNVFLVGLGEDDEGKIGYLHLCSGDDRASSLDISRSVSLGCHPEGFVVCGVSDTLVAVNAADRRCVLLLGIAAETMNQSILAEFPLPHGRSHNFPIAAFSNSVFVGLRAPHHILQLCIESRPAQSAEKGDEKSLKLSLVRTFLSRGADADDIFIHGPSHRLCVVNGSGSVDVFDLRNPAPVVNFSHSVSTAIGARTGWLSLSRHKLYVCAPRSALFCAHIQSLELL